MKLKKYICNFFAVLLLSDFCNILFATGAGIFDGYCEPYERITHSITGINLSWSDFTGGKGLSVSAKIGPNLTVRSIQKADADFYLQLLTGSGIEHLSTGSKDEKKIARYVENWIARIESGNPYAPLTVFYNGRPIGYVLAAAQDKGVCELSMALSKTYQWYGVGRAISEFAFKNLLPALQFVSEGAFSEVITRKFHCGGAPLAFAKATAHPENYGSWKLLLENGFVVMPVSPKAITASIPVNGHIFTETTIATIRNFFTAPHEGFVTVVSADDQSKILAVVSGSDVENTWAKARLHFVRKIAKLPHSKL